MSNLATEAVIGLSAFLLVWYFVGSQVQRRRAGALVKSVQESMAVLGSNARIQWLGNAGFRIDFGAPAPGFKRATVIGMLVPRDLVLVWLYSLLRRRRDLILLRADLERPPSRRHVRSHRELGNRLLGWRAFALQAESPNVHFELAVAPGHEGVIAEAFQLARDLAAGRNVDLPA